MRRFFARLAAFLRPGRAERELSRELAAHLALIEDDLRARGMGAPDARLAARRVYGGVEQAKELHRDARSFVWLEQALQDLRHAFRGLRKSPGFVAVALLSLALGIGVNTAIFTLVHAVLLKRLPVPDPERIVQLKAHFKDFDGASFSYPAFRKIREHAAPFAEVMAFSTQPATLETGEARQTVGVEFVSGNYFAFLGGRPQLGRLIGEEDDLPGAGRAVCVLSHEAWRLRFGGEPGVIGRTIRLSGAALQVVGVAAADFTGPTLQRRSDFWLPTAMLADITKMPRDTATWVWLRLMGRLKPGVSFGEASARFAAATPAIEAALPEDRANRGAEYRIEEASRGSDSWRVALREPLLILMGAVTLVLLVACANLANLLLARAGERRQEYAIMLSLGITRARLLRQFLCETFLVTLAGGALAVGLAAALTRYLVRLFNSGGRYESFHVAPDSTVLLYTLAGCVATALAAGIYPAWQASRTDLARGLASGANLRRAFARRVLILAQVTLAVILVFGASLFAHSLRNLKSENLGVEIDRVLTIEVKDATPGRQSRRVVASPALAATLERLRALPSVEAAAFARPGPFSGQEMGTDLDLPGPGGAKRHLKDVHVMFATPGFLAAMRLPLLRGRDFTSADRGASRRVMLVNQRLASMAWPGEDPIGKQVDGWEGKAEVVGVVGNSHYGAVREDPLPILYEPFDQQKVDGGVLVVRCRGGFAAVERDAREAVKAHAPGYAVDRVASLSLLRDSDISQDRLLAFLSGLFGALGAALALVGIYGLIAYSVTRRTREVGIRVSVGAQRGDVLWLFVRESAALLAAGVAIGLPLAALLARLARAMLYQVSASDPGDMALAAGLLVAGGLAAAIVPGRRAMRIDPVRALRHD